MNEIKFEDEIYKRELEKMMKAFDERNKSYDESFDINKLSRSEKEKLHYDLWNYIYDEYKGVNGIKPRWRLNEWRANDIQDVPDSEINSLIEKISTEARNMEKEAIENIAWEKAEELAYKEMLEHPNAIKAINPDFVEGHADDRHNRKYHVYIPDETPKNNSLAEQLKKFKAREETPVKQNTNKRKKNSL